MQVLTLVSPLTGWLGPLDEVPDPVFADGLMGEGVAVEPTVGEVRAPCDGVVAQLARTRHAVTVRAPGGAEVLVHVGVDTVALAGEGFEALVKEGRPVRAGDLLLRFDLDALARRARSLATPVVMVGGDFAVSRLTPDGPVRAGETVLELRPRMEARAEADTGEASVFREVVTGLEHGIHARPAARIAAALRGSSARVTLACRDRTGDARSVTSLMTLGVRAGDTVRVTAQGPGAGAALEAVCTELEPRPSTPVEAPAPVAEPAAAAPRRLRGVLAAPGVALGAAARLPSRDLEIAARGRGAAVERAALAAAKDRVRGRLEARAAAPGPGGEVAAAHLALLDDPALDAAAQALIAGGAGGGAAWRTVLREQAQALDRLGDARMAERGADLRDLERQVVAALHGGGDAPFAPPAGAILLAEELLPSELADLAPRIAGVVTAGGGPTGHVAIIAAALGLPMLAAAGPDVLQVPDGEPLLVDADAGEALVRPDPDARDRALRRRDRAARRRRDARSAAREPAHTADGVRVEVFANLGAPEEAASAVAEGADGCGLLRTEFLFQDRVDAPGEDEQAAAYQRVADGLAGRPLVLRTLDIGADKPAPYLHLPREDNPALGLRGVRTSLAHPELLRVQLRAALRVRGARLEIMLPMVAGLDELRAVRAVLDAEAFDLGVAAPPLGIMVETPAAAVGAEVLAREAAFFSVGTNDLAQYALAMDRTSPALAARIDGLHPAVLRLTASAVRGAAVHGRPTAVCGGLASDLLAVPLLLGLGVGGLSCAPARAAEVKAAVRGLTLEACRAAAEATLHLASAAEVRALAADRFPELAP